MHLDSIVLMERYEIWLLCSLSSCQQTKIHKYESIFLVWTIDFFCRCISGFDLVLIMEQMSPSANKTSPFMMNWACFFSCLYCLLTMYWCVVNVFYFDTERKKHVVRFFIILSLKMISKLWKSLQHLKRWTNYAFCYRCSKVAELYSQRLILFWTNC